MKKIMIITLLLLVSHINYSQTRYFYGYTSSAHSHYNITHYGNLSLGALVTEDPIFPLTIYKSDNVGIKIKQDNGEFEISRAGCNGCFDPSAVIGDVVLRNLGNSHSILFNMPDNNNDGHNKIAITDNLHRNNFQVYNNGKVTIGTTLFDDEDYKLYVKDGIKTEKIKVEIAANNNWADYVFNKDYKLMPLDELEKYLNEHKHLPEVPTTEQVIKNGVELKEMNILLLKKIEELTLHLIKQEKRIKDLEAKLAK